MVKTNVRVVNKGNNSMLSAYKFGLACVIAYSAYVYQGREI